MSRTMSLAQSFGYAISGLKTALKQEPNFQIHIVISAVALVLALALDFSLFEWLLLLFTISFVLIMELVNTVLENLVDLVSPKIHPKAKAAKDVAAAAVLVSAWVSILIGVALFIPKIWLLSQS